MADESGHGDAVLRFALADSAGKPITEDWLTANRFGNSMFVGPSRFVLLPASSASMLKDFIEPPADNADKDGVLSMHYKDRMYRVTVRENVGQKLPVGESGISVEIVKYLANAKPGRKGQFTSRGDEPKNPLLELRVHLPDQDKPIRQIAFAKCPFLNLDGVHGWECPVKFWYHHSAVVPQPGAEFMQTPDGKLYCRVAVDGKYQLRGEVKEGDKVKTTARFDFSILKYIPHAREKVTYRPIELAPGETEGPEAAALVEVTAGGATQQVWLQRSDQQYGFQRLLTPEGPLLLTFGYEHRRLGFSLKLIDFSRGMNPGGMGDASFSSLVRVVDKAQEVDEELDISMNQPLVHGKFAFYQSSFQDLPDGRQASVLNVAYDPGRLLKYLGCLMICLGIFIMSYMRIYFFGKVPVLGFKRRTAAGSANGRENTKDRVRAA